MTVWTSARGRAPLLSSLLHAFLPIIPEVLLTGRLAETELPVTTSAPQSLDHCQSAACWR
jgi:hypothetical protein